MNATTAATATSGAVDYPVHVDIDHQEEYPRWMPLVAWVLLIPHYIALVVLGLVAYVVYAIAFFAVLITGRYPEALFHFLVGFHRWGTRVSAYQLWMTSQYPPFSLEARAEDRVRYTVVYPADGVGRLRVFQGILLLPFYIALWIFSLVFILMFVPWFTILFTKRFPKGIFDLMLVWLRWSARATAYASFMVTRYPPFELA